MTLSFLFYKMKKTTLIYIEKDDKYLMLHRNKKVNDINKDKWIGVGGHFQTNESPEECLLREVKEETGLTLINYRLRGIVTFICDSLPEAEYMHLFTADDYEGELIDCNEGTLEWVPKPEIYNLNLWEGDLVFHRLLDEDAPFFLLKLVYQGDKLIEAKLNNQDLL